MLEALEALNLVLALAQQIYTQVKLVEVNQAQCQSLANRIQVLTGALGGLEKLPDKKNYQTALNRLHECLTRCLSFIEQFSNQNKWYKLALKAGTHDKQFTAFNAELSILIDQLDLGLNAQQIINQEQDRADRRKDYALIQERQDEIIRLNQDAKKIIQILEMDEKERHLILMRQLASMQKQISYLNARNPTIKPLIDPHYQIPFFELDINKRLGEGSFGKVYLGKWNGQDVAIKMLEGELNADEQAQFIREINIMSHLRNRSIVQFYGACIEPGRACLVMEYMEQGSLYHLLEHMVFTLSQQQQIALDIARGLHYLHSQDVLHRDLKSSNILIDKHGQAKLADFGLSKAQYASVQTITQRSQAVEWQAPECFQFHGKYDKQSDIYSLGVILWELFTRQKPYKNFSKTQIMQLVLKGEREKIPDTVSETYAKIIEACWQADGAKRPDLSTIIRQIEQYNPRPLSPTSEEYRRQGQKYEQNQKYQEAYDAYQKAMSKGSYRAHTNVGMLFLEGAGVPMDKVQAYQHFVVGSEKGEHERAMYNRAIMLEKGEGTEKNLTQALFWYERAAEKGHKQAPKQIERVKKILQSYKATSSVEEKYADESNSRGFIIKQ